VNIEEIIEQKKSGLKLTKEEIEFVVYSYKNGYINDEKIIDFMKNVNSNNFSYEETFFLADALARTGEMLNISNDVDFVIDKHSAGNISDPTTLIFMSVMATLGVKNVKVLSNSYGDFGSSLSRFKCFKGFNAQITRNELIKIINKIGFGVIEDSGNIAPVDKKLYLLRKKYNITSEPLIAASILAKKIATGVNAIIFDVKAGEGAIYSSEEFSLSLANYLVNTSKLAGINSVGVITNLDQTVGASIGPRVELEEAINVLRCERTFFDAKLLDVARELVIVTLCLLKKANGRSEASEMFDEAINSGKALDKFRELILNYSGEYEDLKHSAKTLLRGVAISYVTAKEEGFVSDIILKDLTKCYVDMSRSKKDYFDKDAGIVVLKREGQKVFAGDKLMRVFYNVENKGYFSVIEKMRSSVKISKTKPKTHKIFYKVIV